jgi:hypothetical protein
MVKSIFAVGLELKFRTREATGFSFSTSDHFVAGNHKMAALSVITSGVAET